MDPNACWKEFLDHVAENDAYAAYDCIERLLAWINKGGFPPHNVDKKTIQVFHRIIGSTDGPRF